ncbi:hypothetical protein [Tissierella sp. Yu-01]|uniref:hypothetical protein n=1 Tax=Tissierella sp. Yu-01 TaxID=3035694 RepID=UPI00240E283B|nr:hypothetical protein [Tissierella sp. Yu-01]WFA09928.1 hypothetical protein P3962_05095 [Tissierella sp. Yu-01]
MKKLITVLSFILVLSMGTMFVFAETTVDEDALSWFRGRMGYRKEALKDALNDGDITQEQYNTWDEHFNYMEEFHKENGFPGGRGFGGCHGGRGYNRRGMNW